MEEIGEGIKYKIRAGRKVSGLKLLLRGGVVSVLLVLHHVEIGVHLVDVSGDFVGRDEELVVEGAEELPLELIHNLLGDAAHAGEVGVGEVEVFGEFGGDQYSGY